MIAIKKQLLRWLDRQSLFLDGIPREKVWLWIIIASGLSLFLELMIIRIHSSYFQLFAYFKNVSLLSCFLGLGVGFAGGSRKPKFLPFVIPLIGFQILAMYLLKLSPVASYFQNPISEQLTMGLSQATETARQSAVYMFLALVFIFNALCFIPIGQLVSFLMGKQDKLTSYGFNLIGSLLGIIAFMIVSFLWTPPVVWFILAALFLILFIRADLHAYFLAAVTVMLLIFFTTDRFNSNRFDIYSPYQLLTLTIEKDRPPILETSNTYYQKILDLSPKASDGDENLKYFNEYYSLPYHFQPKPADVLVVGSGTGNDVAAGVRNGAGNIDAVEIDPAILTIGKNLHPESPYQSYHVNAYVDDARNFIKSTRKKYDLIVYGLLDSHTLLSGQSGVRLDSYIYTVEAFREARSKLKDKGIMSLTFSLLRPDMGRKLYVMLSDAFGGKPPLVYYSLYDGGFTFLAGDGMKNAQDPAVKFIKVDLFADKNIIVDQSTDDWPFFYMARRQYPVSYLFIILLLVIVSLVIIRKAVPGKDRGFSLPMFFLGAGFMQLETKAITELALIYGSTWIVTSIVIIFILLMGFLANILVMKKVRIPAFPVYGLLFLSLVLGYFITYTRWSDKIFSPLILTLPVFFSGLAFSDGLKKSKSVSVSLYSNLLGAILGGFLEYNSMYFGYRSLYIIAFAMYFLAVLSSTGLKSRLSSPHTRLQF